MLRSRLTTEQVAQHFHRALTEQGDPGSPVSEEVVLDCARRTDVQVQANVDTNRRDGAHWCGGAVCEKGSCNVQLCTLARDPGRAGECASLGHVEATADGAYAT